MKLFRRFFYDERGATMVEYAVMLAMVAAVCLTLIAALGSNTHGLFAPLSSKWNSL